MEKRSQRRPHFRRVETPNFKLQPRDVGIIQQVYKHRFLRSTHLAALAGGSEQQIRRRLQLLFHNAYLDRPREQLAYQRENRRPYAYGLGNKGADLLARDFAIRRDKVDWTAKNRTVGQIFLDHTLQVSDFMVALELACRANGKVRIIDAGEVLSRAPEHTRKRKNPLSWSVSLRHQGKRVGIGVIPDKIFGLRFLDRPEGANRAYFFLEADRGTMPVKRATLARSSVYRKLLAYYETWRQGLHTQTFNIKNFRVLTVTSGGNRAHHILEVSQELSHGVGSRLFLFADRIALETNPLELTWTDGKGDPAKLT